MDLNHRKTTLDSFYSLAPQDLKSQSFRSPPLNSHEQKIHQQALTLGQSLRHTQVQLLEIFSQISEKRIHHKLGYRSLHDYGVKALGLSDAISYALGAILKKSKEVPVLIQSVQSGELSLCRASRLVSVLSGENADELIEFAKNHRAREIDQEVARRNPRKKLRDDVKTLSEDCIRLSLSLSQAEMKSLERCQNLLASRGGRNLDLSKTLSLLAQEYLRRYDPVQKAERAKIRKTKTSQSFLHTQKSSPNESTSFHLKNPTMISDLICESNSIETVRSNAESNPIWDSKQPSSASFSQQFNPQSEPVAKEFFRRPLSAERKHQVHFRDKGRCTYINESGHRCDQERWLHIHHLQPVGEGGTDELSNLQTLCSFHHDLIHQLSFADWTEVRFLARGELNGEYGLQ